MKTIQKPSQSNITIKKSQFICNLFPSKNKEESKKIIQEISKKYSDATHNCTAYITSNGEGYDDDGEPSGTAGRPMLNVLRKNNLNNITAIVTRYFGGIKLGSGGLVRAYSKSVLESIENSQIIEVDIYDIYSIVFDYNQIKLVENEIRKNNLEILSKEYKDKVIYDIVSKEKVSIDSIFDKFNLKIKVNFKNKEILKK